LEEMHTTMFREALFLHRIRVFTKRRGKSLTRRRKPLPCRGEIFKDGDLFAWYWK
jgi:hypothetical protein